MPKRPDDSDDKTVKLRPTDDTVKIAPRRTTPGGGNTLGDGRYEVVDALARGGMGEIMVARDSQLGRDVAVKRMLLEVPSDDAIERFLREARVQGRLDHPAIVPVHELGRDDGGLPYFVMKKVSGTTLSDIVKADDAARFPRQRLLRAFVDVCLAVEFAHVRGVVHRDLKPANIVLGDYGEVYVLDWGIAKITGVEDGEFTDVSPSGSGGHETEAGTVVGTAGYIAPEQVRGASDIDARVDVYSLGCTLFEILAGERLHPAGFDGLASAVDGTECRPSVRAPLRDVPPELDAVCVQATIGDRDARISSARELGTRVERFLDGDRDLAARRELARTHLARAEAAIAAGDHDDARRIAMQEAGRALALDPSLAAAATLVTRLMIEPPKVTPREVVAEIAATEQTIAAGFLRLAAWLFLGFLAFTPILWWIAPSSSGWVPLLAGAIAGCAGVTWFGSRKPTLWRMLACTLVTTGTLAVVSRMYSPLLIAPGLAILLVVVTTITTVAPTWFASTVIPLFSIVATIGPWLAERAGWLSRTTSVVDEGLVQLRLAAVAGRELPILGVAALYTCMLIGAAAIFATAIRARDHTMKRRLHLQAWQLRQLVAR